MANSSPADGTAVMPFDPRGRNDLSQNPMTPCPGDMSLRREQTRQRLRRRRTRRRASDARDDAIQTRGCVARRFISLRHRPMRQRTGDRDQSAMKPASRWRWLKAKFSARFGRVSNCGRRSHRARPAAIVYPDSRTAGRGCGPGAFQHSFRWGRFFGITPFNFPLNLIVRTKSLRPWLPAARSSSSRRHKRPPQR